MSARKTYPVVQNLPLLIIQSAVVRNSILWFERRHAETTRAVLTREDMVAFSWRYERNATSKVKQKSKRMMLEKPDRDYVDPQRWKQRTVHLALGRNVKNGSLDGYVDGFGLVRAIVLGEVFDRDRVVLGWAGSETKRSRGGGELECV